MADICLINEQNTLAQFQAELISYETKSGEIDSISHQILNCSDFFLVKNKANLGRLQLKFLVEKESTAEASKMASRFITSILGKSATIKINSSDSFYGYLSEYELEQIELDGFCWLTMVFKALRRGDLKTATLANGTGNINNIGSLESGAKLVLTAFQDVENFDVFNIHIRELKANEPLIIDGIKGSVMQGNKNAFSNVELFDFPKLESGNNQIVSSKSVRLEISYYPFDLI